MDIKKEEIIKYGVAILAVLNLIWLFGFEYRLPGKAADRPAVEEVAGAATTAEATEVAAAAVTIAIAEEEEPQEEIETENNMVRCRVTVSNSLNIREGPGTGYKVVTTANYNEMMTVLGVENGWVHVRNDGGQEGYVSESYVEFVEDQSE